MKIVIYNRVSTTDQSSANQISILCQCAEQRSYTLLEVYQEAESAWRDGHQRELARLITDAQKGKFKFVMVWALDRISRQGAMAVLELVNKLNRWGVKVLSYQEPWTEAPGELEELLYALTGWVARMESQRRSERTKAGLARLVASGKTLGRSTGIRIREKGNEEINLCRIFLLFLNPLLVQTLFLFLHTRAQV